MKIIKIAAKDNRTVATYEEAREKLIEWQLSDEGFLLKSRPTSEDAFIKHSKTVTNGWDKRIPTNPHLIYRDSGFISWPLFLGYDDPRIQEKYDFTQDFRPFATYEEARERLIEWQLSDEGFLLSAGRATNKYFSKNLDKITAGWDKKIPTEPNKYYKKKGFVNFFNLMGHDDPKVQQKYNIQLPDYRVFATYEEAREKLIEWQLSDEGFLLRSNRLSDSQFAKYLDTIIKGWDKKIPVGASTTYDDFVSWNNLLGHDDPRIQEKYDFTLDERPFATYEEAREKLIEWQLSDEGVLLKSSKESDYLYSKHLDKITAGWDKKIPVRASEFYKEKGFIDWPTFFGHDDPRIQSLESFRMQGHPAVSTKGISKSSSWHEVVIRDIFFFIGAKFTYEPKNWTSLPFAKEFAKNSFSEAKEYNARYLQKKKNEDPKYQMPISPYENFYPKPDFLLGGDILFEVFGGSSDKEIYKIRMGFKKEIFSKYFKKHFAFIDEKPLNKAAKNSRTLTSYASSLDQDSCNPFECGEGVLGMQIVSRLETIAPLLAKENIHIAQNYHTQIVNFYKNKELELLKYKVVDKLVPQWEDWRYEEELSEDQNVAPIPFHNASKKSWNKTAQSSRTELATIQQIEQGLQEEGFWSSHLWSDNDKIAMYFKTPENIQAALEGISPKNQNQIVEPPTPQELQMVANNWYEVKTAEEVPENFDPLPDSLPDEEIAHEEQLMQTDLKTGKDITYIRQHQVEHILDQFIVDQLSGATLSKRFSIDYETESRELKTVVGMRMVNHPYTKYNLSADDRRMLATAIRDRDQMALYEFFSDNDATTLKRKKTPRRSRLNYNPNRSRRTRYPVTKMQETRDKHGMVGVFHLSKAKELSQSLQADFGALFEKEEMELLKSIAVTDAYINIYPNRVAVIRGNGQVWVVDDSNANEFNLTASNSWYIVESARTSYINVKEYMNRLRALGWEVAIPPRGATHVKATAPAGKSVGRVGFSHNKTNWEQSWLNQKEDLLHISRDLEFVFVNPFVIPEGFNKMTLKIEEKPQFVEKVIYFNQLRNSLLKDITIFVNGIWKQPEIVDHTDGSLMFSDEEIRTYKPNDQVIVKVPNK